ncbi:glycosyltransferase family 9 protein [Siphonobacter sp. SORGH_AS_1065]|uniref:glycosyltransferase family 9 protein n=1 Tax=Siphonobacter sp. SORGH_AS_1065 TaxID=3041795 RepID=UPI0027830BE1|nr:glycosyltransferase family 9 protein [Siphonobacter sp. SORGH_AS_1065]MDQ1086379.1 ADP-heptose:LPS heptosyltransferase [Siphonobacter sp. SORGH_AS_1065]
MKQLIIFRFSAMGDVALLTPVVQAIARQYPDRQLTVVTRPKLAAFFEGMAGVKVFPADLQGRHKGIKGLYQLYRDLKKGGEIEYVIDTHQNLRTSILKSFFALSGVRFTTIDKGRSDKKALTRPENKVLKPLPHSIERYLQTFEKAGYKAQIAAPPYFSLTAQGELERFLQDQAIPAKSTDMQWIGLAPFAQHKQKMWPFDRMQKVLELITQQQNVRIFLFGGGEVEIAQLRTLEQAFPQAKVVAGKLSFQGELTLIHQLDLMICMDSSNMHLATLNGVPVVSIWGATHPFAGFGPWMQSEENMVQVSTEELSCRPCSVFGNKPCARGDLACLDWITPETVANRALALLQH